MKQFYLKSLLSCLFLLTGMTAFAYDCEVDGIYYDLDKTAKTASVTYQSKIEKGNTSSYKSNYSGDIAIPSTIIYEDVTYDVTNIGDYAFIGCTDLVSVTIPNSVTTIGRSAFGSCSSLTSVTIPNSVTSIVGAAFSGCDNLKKVTLDCATLLREEHSYGTYGFGFFSNAFGAQVTHVIIGENCTSIGNGFFNKCENMTEIDIPQSVKFIGNGAFYGCSGLTSVHITDLSAWCNISFRNQDSNPLYYAHHLYLNEEEVKDLVIPSSVTSVGYNAFNGCSGLTSVIIPNTVTTIDSNAFLGCSGLTSITLHDKIESIGSAAFPNNVPIYTKRGTVSLITLWNAGYTPYETGTENKLGAPYVVQTSSTQTTVSGKIENYYPEFTYECYSTLLKKSEFTLTGLRPGDTGTTYYQFKVFLNEKDYDLRYDSKVELVYYQDRGYFQTLSLSPSITATSTASSIQIAGSYVEGDAVVTAQKMKINGVETEGNSMTITGLDPNTSYTAEYTVTVGSKQYSTTKSFTTEPLTLTTSQPKVVSVGNVIVAAEANLDEEETGVGFEWRRTDWTDDFSSNTGGAAIYDGVMEGYIRNLNIEKLWKYRAYYLSNSGTYYYGDWVGLDPTNTSYFEPTVHTYAKVGVEGNTALVKGYALTGTDKVTVQGFKYWKTVSGGSAAQRRAVAVPSDAQTVEASGQVMTANLTGLDYNATYHYVAFVTTAEGDTFYGEEQMFETGDDPTGIGGIAAEETDVWRSARSGIYTLQGVKVADDATALKALPKGIYIVNGKKVWAK